MSRTNHRAGAGSRRTGTAIAAIAASAAFAALVAIAASTAFASPAAPAGEGGGSASAGPGIPPAAVSAVEPAGRTAGKAVPRLEAGEAVYRLDQNVLEFSFTLVNPADSAIFLDCQGDPEVSLEGRTLLLRFAAPDEAALDTARPQRIGARQGFQGRRRIHGLGLDHLGQAKGSRPADPAGAASLALEMAVYPERNEGEGQPWVRERATRAVSEAVPLRKKGKRPPPPKPVKIRR